MFNESTGYCSCCEIDSLSIASANDDSNLRRRILSSEIISSENESIYGYEKKLETIYLHSNTTTIIDRYNEFKAQII